MCRFPKQYDQISDDGYEDSDSDYGGYYYDSDYSDWYSVLSGGLWSF